MKRMRQAALLGLWLIAAGTGAQTRYVTDEIVITFRTGPSTQNAVTRNLSSGDRVEVLEALAEEGFSRVRLDDGEEGWVLTRYLQEDETGDMRVAAAERDLAAAQRAVQSLESRVAALEAELGQTEQALDVAETTSERLNEDLADVREASSSALELREQNETLRRRITELSSAVDVADTEIRELRSRNRQSWFIIGAGVLFGGIVIGLVAPSLRRKRRTSW